MNEYLTVSKLNLYIKSLVESDFSLMNLTVIGEISSLTKHYTGHYYFTLKDDTSQIKCMMFSSYASKVDFNLENGMQVLIQGYLGVYDKGGTYQLYCRKIMLYGEGQYLLNLEKLKKKLESEGVFDKERKEIPFLPKRIGLISASTGAAMRDYITTVKSRLNTEIYLFPCLVQGEDASKSIIKAIAESIDYNVDLLVITRGGGSKDDLKVFNDEALVRFVGNLDIPVITAIGHKIDTTLIDYVSTRSCITPTDAAVKSVPDKDDLVNRINVLIDRAYYRVSYIIENNSEKLVYYDKSLLLNSPINKLNRIKETINNFDKKYNILIKPILNRKYLSLTNLMNDLSRIYCDRLNNYYQKITLLNHKLSYLNPYSLLGSGYGMISINDNVVSSLDEIDVNQVIKIQLKDGEITAVVKEKKYDI